MPWDEELHEVLSYQIRDRHGNIVKNTANAYSNPKGEKREVDEKKPLPQFFKPMP